MSILISHTSMWRTFSHLFFLIAFNYYYVLLCFLVCLLVDDSEDVEFLIINEKKITSKRFKSLSNEPKKNIYFLYFV